MGTFNAFLLFAEGEVTVVVTSTIDNDRNAGLLVYLLLYCDLYTVTTSSPCPRDTVSIDDHVNQAVPF